MTERSTTTTEGQRAAVASPRRTGAEAVVATLAAQGIDTVFGIPGGHCIGLYDALSREPRIRHVLGRHEQGLAFMADGYARASGRIAAAITTSGPGVANMAAALGGATTDTSSVLAIASTVRSELLGKNRGGLHDLNDALDIMRPVCRKVATCHAVEQIPRTLGDLIFQLKCRRPGAVFCQIPQDVLGAEANVKMPGPVDHPRLEPDAAGVSRATSMLQSAQQPLIWAGTGALVSGADAVIEQLAERLGAPVVTTSLARGLLAADHPRAVTKDGGRSTEVDVFIADADVVLAVGTMFKQEDTANWGLKPGKKLIHIDVDDQEIGRSYEADLGIVADARAAIEAILQEMPAREQAAPSWMARGTEAQAAALAQRRAESPQEMTVLDAFRSAVPRDAIVLCDRCNLGYWAWRCMPAYEPRSFVYPMGYGGLGGAMPQAIGAKLADPARPVVCVIGDGGFQFTGPELIVAVQDEVPITIVLCNNNSYGAIAAAMTNSFGAAPLGCKLQNPDFQKLAAAYGVPHVRADNAKSLGEKVAAGIASNALNIIEMTIDVSDPPG